MMSTKAQIQEDVDVLEAETHTYEIVLHNDDVNDIVFVADTIIELTTLNREDAVLRTLEAHQRGLALLLTTHREHAELLQEQFTSKRLSVTIEPSC